MLPPNDDSVESMAMARRRETPDMIRDLVMAGHQEILLALDWVTALNLADDLEFAVKNRKLDED
jgi:hypothetical protein